MLDATEKILSDNDVEMLIDEFQKRNFSYLEIAKIIESLNDLERRSLHLIASRIHQKALAKKIQKAIDLISRNRIEHFKESVREGNYEDFLSGLTSYDKKCLMADMKLYKPLFSEKKPLSSEEQKYLDIINKSIEDDLKKESHSL